MKYVITNRKNESIVIKLNFPVMPLEKLGWVRLNFYRNYVYLRTGGTYFEICQVKNENLGI